MSIRPIQPDGEGAINSGSDRIGTYLEDFMRFRAREGQEALDAREHAHAVAEKEEQHEEHDQPAGGAGNRSNRGPKNRHEKQIGDDGAKKSAQHRRGREPVERTVGRLTVEVVR